MTLQVGPVIGKVGGGEVTATPWSVPSLTTSGTSTSVTVPAGQTWLIAVAGTAKGLSYSASYAPTLTVGSVAVRPLDGNEQPLCCTITAAAGTTTITVKANLVAGGFFTGTIYTTPM